MSEITLSPQVSGSPVDLLSEIPPPVWWTVGVVFAAAFGVTAAIYLIKGLRSVGRLMTSKATDERRTAARKAAGNVSLYGLLYFFWAVAAGISMQGLIGFAEDNMGLTGPWPYLIFFSLDGAAAFCMVLVTMRAGRAASTFTPRLAVWALVALSSWFNITHAPDHPGAKLAWAAIPIIAGALFELAQAETRNQAADPSRRVSAIQWLHPVERIRVLLELAADTQVSADEATVRVRDSAAAAWLYRMRTCWPLTRGVVRWRTRVALARADFADPARAEEILRRVQIFAQTDVFAGMDYQTPVAARLALGNLIGSEVVPAIAPAAASPLPIKSIPGSIIPAGPPSVAPVTSLARFQALVPALVSHAGVLTPGTGSAVNGHAAPQSPASPVNGSNTGAHGHTQGQPEGQASRRKRPSRATYQRSEKLAIEFVVERARAGVETRWQDVQTRFPSRSRNWCEGKLAKGLAAWAAESAPPSP